VIKSKIYVGFLLISLLRLAAQKEGAQAENGLLRRTDLMVSHHKNYYSRGGKVLQPQISQI